MREAAAASNTTPPTQFLVAEKEKYVYRRSRRVHW